MICSIGKNQYYSIGGRDLVQKKKIRKTKERKLIEEVKGKRTKSKTKYGTCKEGKIGVWIDSDGTILFITKDRSGISPFILELDIDEAEKYMHGIAKAISESRRIHQQKKDKNV